MHVFVTVSELTGRQRDLSLGDLEPNVTLEEVLQQCLNHIDKHLHESDRTDSRHFWFQNHIVPYTRRYLNDISSVANINLELRPDEYHVKLPGRRSGRYRFDPEKHVAWAIDRLMGYDGASCCFELLKSEGRPLQEDRSLLEQGALPYHTRLDQPDLPLVVRRKRRTYVTAGAILAVAIVAGLLIGYVISNH
jgi:hypothetical protein